MTAHTIRLFVASPSDVAEERRLVGRVAARLEARRGDVAIETFRWEDGAFYSAHAGFQPQIQDVAEFDIVVGLFWTRLGKPLPPNHPRQPDGRPYPSGTAFEVLRAIGLRRDGAPRPDVLVYRKTEAPTISALDAAARRARLDALERLDAFFAEWFVNDRDGFKGAFFDFETADALERLLETHLDDWIEKRLPPRDGLRWRIDRQGSPFRGLAAFDETHGEVFFGRDADVERALGRLAEAERRGRPFLLIEGASGVGKSSLMAAGLLPRLRAGETDLRVARFRPGDPGGPAAAFARALLATDALPELRDGDFAEAEALAALLSRSGDVTAILRALDRAAWAVAERFGLQRPPALRLAVFVDQMEELFAGGVAAQERVSVSEALRALVDSRRCLCVASMRSDARAQALEIEAIGRLIEESASFVLRAPTADALADIVRRPAEAAGLAFERDKEGRGLDEVILVEAADATALPLLQFALAELCAAALRRGVSTPDDGVAEAGARTLLSFEDYRALGGLSGAIARRAEQAVSALPPSTLAALPRVVRALVDVGRPGARALRAATRAELGDGDEVAALLEALVAARVLVRDADSVRFAHEVALSAWGRARDIVDAAASFIALRRDCTEAERAWSAQGCRSDLLISPGVRLEEAAVALAAYGAELPHPVRRFIALSQNRARRRQRLTAFAAMVFALAATVAGWKFVEADAERARAEANERGARAARFAAEKATGLAIETADGLVREIAEVFLNRGLPIDVARSVLDRALALQSALPSIGADSADLAQSRAGALSAAGHLLVVTGDPERGEPLLYEARDGFRRLLALDASNLEWNAGLSQTLERIANLNYWRGDVDAAASVFRAGLSLRRTPPAEGAVARSVELTAQAELLLLAQDYAGAQPILEVAVGLIDDLAKGASPDDPMRVFAARPLRHLGMTLLAQGAFSRAHEALVTAYALAAQHVGREPNSLYAKLFAWEAAIGLATVAEEVGDRDAQLYLSRAEQYAERSVALDPASEQAQRMLLAARVAMLRRELSERTTWLIDVRREQLAPLAEAGGAVGRDTLDWITLRADYQATMGEAALAEGGAAAAAERFRAALGILNGAHERLARFHQYHELRSRALFGLAQTQSDAVKAQELYTESLFYLGRAEARSAPLRAQRERRTALERLLGGTSAGVAALLDKGGQQGDP